MPTTTSSSSTLQLFLFPLSLDPGAGASAERDVLLSASTSVASASVDVPSSAHDASGTVAALRPRANTNTTGAAQEDKSPSWRPARIGQSAEEEEAGREAAAGELHGRLLYAAASFLTELGCGAELSRVLPGGRNGNGGNGASSAAAARDGGGGSYAVTAYGERLCAVRPVEQGRYAAVVCVPAAAWRVLGPLAPALLVATTLRGYTVSAAAAAAAGHGPLYCPLHRRLSESAAAVREASEARLGHIGRVLGAFRRGRGRYRERVQALRRMAADRPSAARATPALANALHQCLRAATQPAALGTLQGPLDAYGLPPGERRFQVLAAAVWHRGDPLYSSEGGSATGGAGALPLYEQYLLPAAAAVVLEDCATHMHKHPGFVSAAGAAPHVTRRCVAVALQPREPTPAAGYWRRTDRPSRCYGAEEEGECEGALAGGLVVAGTSGAGWTVALLLTAADVPFLGSALATVTAGVDHLLGSVLDSQPLYAFVQQHTTALLLRRPHAAATSPACAQILAAVVELRLFRRRGRAEECARAASRAGMPALAAPRDVCLYSLVPPFNDKKSRGSHGGGSSGATAAAAIASQDAVQEELRRLDLGTAPFSAVTQSYWPRVECVLRVAARLPAHTRHGSSSGGDGNPLRLSQTVFSILRGRNHVVLCHAAPNSNSNNSRSGGGGGICYAVALLDKERLPNSLLNAGGDAAFGFTTWLLSKVI